MTLTHIMNVDLYILKITTRIFRFCPLIILFTQVASACTLSLAVSSTFPPYHLQQKQNEWRGVSIDLARTLVEQAGCQLKILDIPWIRAIVLLEQGKIDLLTNFTFTAERAKFAQYLGPHDIERIAFVARKNVSSQVTAIEDLVDFSGLIGITKGSISSQYFERSVTQNPSIAVKLVYIKNTEDVYSMLMHDHLQAMFADQLFEQFLLLRDQKIMSAFDIRFSFPGYPVYFAFSKKKLTGSLKEKLNKAWIQMEDDNIPTQVYQRYGLSYDKQALADSTVKLLDIEN